MIGLGDRPQGLNVAHFQPYQFATVVTEHGAHPDGTDAGAAINAAIQASPEGACILFPGGTYTVETPLLLKANRAYVAQGSVVLKQKANTELDCLVQVDPAEPKPRRNIVWLGIGLDGDAVDANARAQTNNTMYTSGSGYDKNHGMVLDSVQFSNFFGLTVRGMGNNGLVITGSDRWDFGQQSSTNHFISPYLYGCGQHGVLFGLYSDDNHIVGGDIGAHQFEGAVFIAGSSSLRSSTIWGSWQSSGITVGASSNQIVGCQVEGHAQHGIALTEFGNFTTIVGNKIYYNSVQTPGSYDGIYVEGSAANPVRNCLIAGNFIYAGIDDYFLDPTSHIVDPSLFVPMRRAITLDTYHKNFVLAANNVELSGPGAEPDNSILPIYGLANGDIYNGLRFETATDETQRMAAAPKATVPGEVWWRDDVGALRFYTGTGRGRVERLLSSLYDVDAGTLTTSGAGSDNVTIPNLRNDNRYTVLVSPSWNTTWWVTDKFTDQFTIHFGTPSAGATVDWQLIRQGD